MENQAIIMAKEWIIKSIMALKWFNLMKFVQEHKLDWYDTMELVRQSHNELLTRDMNNLKAYKTRLLHISFDKDQYMEDQQRLYHENEEARKELLSTNQLD